MCLFLAKATPFSAGAFWFYLVAAIKLPLFSKAPQEP
jgi:hypothetical protein